MVQTTLRTVKHAPHPPFGALVGNSTCAIQTDYFGGSSTSRLKAMFIVFSLQLFCYPQFPEYSNLVGWSSHHEPEGPVVTKKQAEGAQTILIYSCIMQFVFGLVHIGFLLCIRLLKGWLFKTFDTLPFIIKSSLTFTYTSVCFWMQISIGVQQEAFIFYSCHEKNMSLRTVSSAHT